MLHTLNPFRIPQTCNKVVLYQHCTLDQLEKTVREFALENTWTFYSHMYTLDEHTGNISSKMICYYGGFIEQKSLIRFDLYTDPNGVKVIITVTNGKGRAYNSFDTVNAFERIVDRILGYLNLIYQK